MLVITRYFILYQIQKNLLNTVNILEEENNYILFALNLMINSNFNLISKLQKYKYKMIKIFCFIKVDKIWNLMNIF